MLGMLYELESDKPLFLTLTTDEDRGKTAGGSDKSSVRERL